MKFKLLVFTSLLIASVCSLRAMEGNDNNKQQDQLDTALHEAAKVGNVESLQQLLAQGAQADVIINDRSALMNAAAQGHDQCVQILIENGADIKLKNAAGYSALFFAFERHKFDCSYVLFDAAIQIPMHNFANSCEGCFKEMFVDLPECIVKTQLKENLMLMLCSHNYKVGKFSQLPKPLIFEIAKKIAMQSTLADFHPTNLLNSHQSLIFQIIDDLEILVDKVIEMEANVAEVVLVNHRVILNNLLETYKLLIDLKKQFVKEGNENNELLGRLLLKSQKLFCKKNYKEKKAEQGICQIF